jgi:hypothetical protein
MQINIPIYVLFLYSESLQVWNMFLLQQNCHGKKTWKKSKYVGAYLCSYVPTYIPLCTCTFFWHIHMRWKFIGCEIEHCRGTGLQFYKQKMCWNWRPCVVQLANLDPVETGSERLKLKNCQKKYFLTNLRFLWKSTNSSNYYSCPTSSFLE